MKLITLFLSTCILFLCSCSDDIDSKINGQWQLKTVEENGVVEAVDTVFYSFQKGYVFAFTILSHNNTEKAEISMGYLDFPSDKEVTITMDTSTDENGYFRNIQGDFLEVAGWDDYIQTFNVDRINGKNMILSRGQKTYTFKKY